MSCCFCLRGLNVHLHSAKKVTLWMSLNVVESMSDFKTFPLAETKCPIPIKLHHWKLTWQWKIPMFNRKYIFNIFNCWFSIVILFFGVVDAQSQLLVSRCKSWSLALPPLTMLKTHRSPPLRRTYLYEDQSEETVHLFTFLWSSILCVFLSLASTIFQSEHLVSEVILTWLIASG